MRKLFFTIIALAVLISAKAQWVDNPSTNTFLANTSAVAGEIYTATNHNTGDTYVQWSSDADNGWSPTLQRINSAGVPQWGDDGIHIANHQFASYSQGVAMATTSDGGVVSCFAANDGHSYAVKINPDGTFAIPGFQLFDGQGFSRVEVIATDDGGFWALGSDYEKLYLQYVNETEMMVSAPITISDNNGKNCMFGQLTLGLDNNVFVTYEKCGDGNWTDKEIYVVGYRPNATQFSPETLLMSSQTFQVTYHHYAISDGMGGGYVYIWHSAMYNFNVYVFHFNQLGVSTIMDTNGTPVHSPDNTNLYIDATAIVDPISHDLILVYEQTDDAYQTQCKLFMNRITSYGERVWGDDGIMFYDSGTIPCGGYRADAFEYGGGFSLIYHKGLAQTGTESTVEAKGFDMNHNELWSTQLCSNTYAKTGAHNTPGFHAGQNISVWVNAANGGLYGQNIGWDGTMGGNITPPTPPTPCDPPSNFAGTALYDESTEVSAAYLSWSAPATLPAKYYLYCEQTKELIEIGAGNNSYYLEREPGDYIFKLTAFHHFCGESDFALTPNGDNYVLIEIPDHTSVSEIGYEEIIDIVEIYNINGQIIKANSIDDLNQGIYLIKGMTQSGKTVVRKIVR